LLPVINFKFDITLFNKSMTEAEVSNYLSKCKAKDFIYVDFKEQDSKQAFIIGKLKKV
jgi:hypothetical protein